MKNYLRASFPERNHSDEKSIGELCAEFKSAGYNSIGQIDRALDASYEAVIAYQRDNSHLNLTDVGVARTGVTIFDQHFAMLHTKEYIWSDYQRYVKK